MAAKRRVGRQNERDGGLVSWVLGLQRPRLVDHDMPALDIALLSTEERAMLVELERPRRLLIPGQTRR